MQSAMRKFTTSIVIEVIISILLFLTFIYPGITYLALPTFFDLIIRIAIFIATSAYSIFILQEVYQYYSRCQLAERALAAQKKKPTAEEEFRNLSSLRLGVDPDTNYTEIVRQLLVMVQSALLARTSFIYLFNPQAEVYIFQDGITGVGLELQERLTPEGPLFQNYHLHPKAQILTGEKLSSDCLLYYKEPPQVGTLMVVPILSRNDTFLGFFGVDSIDAGAWHQDDIELVRGAVQLFNLITWEIDVIDQQKLHIQFFSDLCRLNNDLSIGTDTLALYKEASQLLKRFFPFDKITFAQYKAEDSDELVIQYVEGQEADYSIGHQITIAGGVWERVLTADGPCVIADYETAELAFRFQPNDLAVLPFRSALGAALEVGRKRLGGILIESYLPEAYHQDYADILKIFALNLGGILNRIQNFNAMKELAMIDGLTGIYNHRAFKERLQNEIERCRRYGSSLTLLILDLDKFKRINDTYGHLHGDFVLKKTANIIRSSIRTVDTVARYGGEEFAVILINAEKSGCYNTAERIRSNVQSFNFIKEEMNERMTISIGMAEYPADADNQNNLIAAADMAMYNSKRLGGNKITIYQSNPEN